MGAPRRGGTLSHGTGETVETTKTSIAPVARPRINLDHEGRSGQWEGGFGYLAPRVRQRGVVRCQKEGNAWLSPTPEKTKKTVAKQGGRKGTCGSGSPTRSE